MHSSKRASTAFLATATALCLLSGCRVGPKYNVPPTAAQTAPPAYKEVPTAANAGPDIIKTDPAATNPQVAMPPAAAEWKIAQPQDAMLRGKWWEIFNDPDLNALEDKLDIDNQNIKQYFENFMTARALVGEARSQLYPHAERRPWLHPDTFFLKPHQYVRNDGDHGDRYGNRNRHRHGYNDRHNHDDHDRQAEHAD